MRQVLTPLQRLWHRCLVPPVPGKETSLQQAYLLNLTLLGLAGTGFLFGLVSAMLWALNIVPEAAVGVLAGFGVQPFYGLAYWLSRHSRLRLARYIPLLVLFTIMVVASGLVGLGHATIMGFAMLVIVADILVGIRAAAAAVLLSTGVYVTVGWLQLGGWLASPVSPLETLGADVTALALGLFAIWILLGMATRHWRVVLQNYLTQLQCQGQELEATYQEKTRLMQELQSRTEKHIRLMETLQQLSVSLIPVTDQILILPLAGDVDVDRMEQITAGLLDGVVERCARVVILDLTSVSRFDAGAVNRVVEAAQSVCLLGCELFLVGMSRQVADALADQEPLMREIVILGDLQDGIACALARLGQQIITIDQSPEWGGQILKLGAETRLVS